MPPTGRAGPVWAQGRIVPDTRPTHRRAGYRTRNSGRPPAGLRQSRTDPVRSLALSVLRHIREHGQYANLVLPAWLDRAGLSGRDAALATTLVYGCLRWQGFLDAVIDTARDRRRKGILDPQVRDVLRLGAYQLLFLDVPAYAAVSTSCDLARSGRTTRAAVGLVDALLRAVSRRTRSEWGSLLTSRISKARPLERLSVRTSHPLWIVRELARSRAAAGYETGWSSLTQDRRRNLLDLLEADNADPAVTLCARPGLVTRDELLRQARALGPNVNAGPGRYSPYAVRLHGVDPARLDAVGTGRAGVEDEGSQLAVIALTSAPLDSVPTVPCTVPSRPEPAPSPSAGGSSGHSNSGRWLDLCAGPGGKAALLGALAARTGARLVANEPQEHRARLVEQNLRALPQDTVETVTRLDGRDYGRPAHDGRPATAACFDRVLVDAPCSGLGALRRRPEARWTKKREDIDDLSVLQRGLLSAGLDATRHGGVLAYVTCSPVLEETREVVDAVLAGRDDAERLDTASILRMSLPDADIPLTGQGDVQLFSDLHDTDMMFICLIRRR